MLDALEDVAPSGQSIELNDVYGLRIVNASVGATWAFDEGAARPITCLQTVIAPEGQAFRRIKLSAGSNGELRVQVARAANQRSIIASGSPAPLPPTQD